VTEERSRHVLIAGLTTRALALSAVRAGYRVTAVDAFGDLDLRAASEVVKLPRDRRYRPLAAARAGAQEPAGLVAYTSNFENYPEAVDLLASGRRLLGNSPEVLRRSRNPIAVMRLLRHHGFATPESRGTAIPATGTLRSWLLKPRRSGGGHGIRAWQPGTPVPRSSYLQERIPGRVGSIIFAADGTGAVPLGFSLQLVGDPHLGASGFRYCGSMLGNSAARLFPQQDRLLETAAAMATVLSRELHLVGLNGLDFIARQGIPYPIEVNPRFSASMELLEREHGLSMFEIHAGASQGILPLIPARTGLVHGKAIVFARRDLVLGDTRSWLEDPSLADIPHPGERIHRGRPICTVFARARSGVTCQRLLRRRAAAIYRVVESGRRHAA
jgi:predicted ATP-grasp superfamily ATP-dependent carboligase